MFTRRRAILAAAAGTLAATVGASLPRAQTRLPGRTAQRVPFGACARAVPLAEEADYRAALRQYCQQLTSESGLTWEVLRPTRQQFRFEFADAAVAFAQANGMAVRGHTLAWYGAMPLWAKEIASAREAERELVTHIERVVSRYRGKIKTWHVVNEPIDEAAAGVVPGARPSVWQKYLGERYIDIALRTAHQVDPAAALLVNEYDIESADAAQPKKRQALLKLVRELRERGLPIHGVGLQGHLRGQLPIDRDGLYDFVSELRALALAVHVTELDVVDDRLPGPGDLRDLMVAARAYDFLEPIFAAMPPAAVACWGITDRHTWVPTWFKRKDGLPNRPLPLDANYRPKPLWNVIDYFCSLPA